VALQLVDIGINLMHRSFNADRDQVLRRAIESGVTRLIITGANERSSQEASAFARQFPGTLYATAGVHPHDARHCTPDTIQTLRDLAKRAEVVAIGECGLDYNRDFSPRPVQDHWFEAQIQLACALKMPLFLHERDSHQRLVEILSRYKDQLGKVVVHCFTGHTGELETYLDMGFYIGITGWICDERRGTHLRDLLWRIPPDRLMLETDAPFLIPRDMRPQPKGGRNEPAFLPHILRAVAAALEKSPEEVATAATETTRAFFGIA
jgi:TatD DNase family protein